MFLSDFIINVFSDHYPRMTKPMMAAAFFMILAAFAIFWKVFDKYDQKKRTLKAGAMTALVHYLYLCLLSTVFAREYRPRRFEPLLFTSYKRALAGDLECGRDIFLNYFLLMPIGIILCAVFARHDRISKKGVLLSVLPAFAVSLFIETSQYIANRGLTEADDLMGNTLGSFIGYLLVLLLFRLREKYKNKKMLYKKEIKT